MRTKQIRGIESIVAAVLLIIIAVVGATLLYMWFSGYLSRTAGQAESASNMEKLKVEAVSYDLTNGNVSATVRNVGEITITIDGAFVLDRFDNVICSVTNLDQTLNAGQSYTVQITGCTLQNGEQYFVKVVTDKGTEAMTSFRTPPA